MSLTGISSSSVSAAYAQPLPAPPPQQAKTAQQAPLKDTVSISPRAQQLASDGDPTALEARESSAEKATESARGKA